MNKIQVELSNDLRRKYGLRSFPIAKGDIVKILKGGRKGEGGKVAAVDHLKLRVTVDGITINKADNKQKEFTLRPEMLEISRLDLSRNERVEKIRKLASMKKIVIDENDLKQEPEPEPEPEQLPETEALPESSEEQVQEASTTQQEPEVEGTETAEETEEEASAPEKEEEKNDDNKD